MVENHGHADCAELVLRSLHDMTDILTRLLSTLGISHRQIENARFKEIPSKSTFWNHRYIFVQSLINSLQQPPMQSTREASQPPSSTCPVNPPSSPLKPAKGAKPRRRRQNNHWTRIKRAAPRQQTHPPAKKQAMGPAARVESRRHPATKPTNTPNRPSAVQKQQGRGRQTITKGPYELRGTRSRSYVTK